ncbi:hypothetical protein [Aureivirga marina]|uniref:hypothetical protein n=1 Tax=Aureivirga marina TaxID=1182451 RepID=UPI0018CB128C|nr:hypothetical protein [Aureivirga marina]
MKRILIVLLLITFKTFAQKNVSIEFHDNAYYDVFIGDVNLTNFKPWEQVLDLKVSPDKRYFFFRHKEDKGKAYKLTLYDFQTQKKIAEITPGFGGSFEWTMNNKIIHRWGCGTNCANFRMYDLSLNEIFFTLSSGGFLESPKKDILVQFGMRGKDFWIFDLRSIQEDQSVKIFHKKFSERDEMNIWSLKFDSNYSFSLETHDDVSKKEVLKFIVDELSFKYGKSADIREYYSR